MLDVCHNNVILQFLLANSRPFTTCLQVKNSKQTLNNFKYGLLFHEERDKLLASQQLTTTSTYWQN